MCVYTANSLKVVEGDWLLLHCVGAFLGIDKSVSKRDLPCIYHHKNVGNNYAGLMFNFKAIVSA